MSEQNGNSTSSNGNTPSSGGYLAAQHVQKTYGRRRVVDDVSVTVGPGEVVGLLGANGAGKPTSI